MGGGDRSRGDGMSRVMRAERVEVSLDGGRYVGVKKHERLASDHRRWKRKRERQSGRKKGPICRICCASVGEGWRRLKTKRSGRGGGGDQKAGCAYASSVRLRL